MPGDGRHGYATSAAYSYTGGRFTVALGARYLGSLIKGIGPDSAFARVVQEQAPPARPTTDEQQLHAFFDVDVVRRT